MTDLEKAARMALEVAGLIGADLVCDAAHHKKADRHGIGEPCPVQARWHHAFAALRQALEQPAQQEPVDWEAVAADQAMTIAMMKAEQEAAVLAEREACAQVCDDRDMGDCNREDMEARACAAAIRERNQA